MTLNSHDPRHAPRWQWWLALVAGVLTVVCGSIGIWKYDQEYAPGVGHGFNPIYHALQMLILHTPHFEEGMNGWIEAGRWFGALTLLITSTAILWKRLRHEFNLLRLAGWSGHHVVCGLGQKGFEIVRCLKDRDPATRIVVIDPQPDPYLAEKSDQLGVCVIRADATQAEVLAQARVAHAEEVVVITPNDETNVRIATQIRQLPFLGKSNPTKCFVHLSNIHLRERLQRLAGSGADAKPGCVLNFFDVFDNEARRVLLELPLDGAGIAKDAPCSVHVVILGFGRMGRSLALRAAKMGHFANHKPLRISVIDRHADQQREHFLFRYPVLEKQTVCQLNFHQGEAQSLSVRKLIEGWAAEPDTRLHIFICLDDNARALEVGLRLQEALVSHLGCTLQVRIKNRASLADILELSPKSGPRVSTFGMVEDTCCDQAFRHEYNEGIARHSHDEFIKHRLADSNRTPENDPALLPWNDLTEDLRESSRQQADHIALKMRAIGCETATISDPREPVTKFKAEDIELLAELEHIRWNAERWLAGWRHGPPGKKAERISPHLGPWSDLDPSIKKYDYDAITQIPERLGMAQPPLKVVRRSS